MSTSLASHNAPSLRTAALLPFPARRSAMSVVGTESAWEWIELDADHAIRAASLGFCDTLGYGYEELLGVPLIELIAVEQRIAIGALLTSWDLPEVAVLPNVSAAFLACGGGARTLELCFREVGFGEGRARLLGARLTGGVRPVSLQEKALRHPLTAVRGYAGMLAERLEGEADPDTRHCLAQLLSASEELLGMVDGMFTPAAAPAPAPASQPRTCRYEDVVKRAVSSLAPMAVRKRQHLAIEGAEAIRLTADPERVMQVIVNLVENALQFTPEGGTVTVRVRREQADVMTEVVDQGTPLKRAEIAQLFQPFARLERHAGQDGSGLGLAIAKAIVSDHGGSMGAHAARGGMVFWFRLPLAAGR